MWMIIVIISVVCLLLFRKKSKLDLPGPSGLPMIGSLLSIDPERFHVTIDDWARKYGDMYKFHLLGTEVNSSPHIDK